MQDFSGSYEMIEHGFYVASGFGAVFVAMDQMNQIASNFWVAYGVFVSIEVFWSALEF